MKNKLARAALSAWLLGGVAAFAITAYAPTTAFAAEKPKPAKGTKAIGTALNEAITAAKANDWTTAEGKLNEARAVPNPTDFDRVEIDQIAAYLAINSKAPDAHAKALAAYKSAIANPEFANLPENEQQGSLKNAMILANEAKDFATTVSIGEKMMAGGHMDDATAASLAVAYYYNKDYVKARTMAQKSIDAAIAGGAKPDQGSLQIMLKSYADQKDETNARKALEQLVLYYGNDPKTGPDLWGKLIDVNSPTGLKDMQMLQLYRLRYLAAASSEAGDYAIGAELAMKNGYPGEARNILQLGIQRGQGNGGAALNEARSKAAADEKTLASQAAASEKSPNGQQDTITAELFYGYGRYAEAEAAARRATTKGGAKDPEEAKMLLGMSLAAQGKYSDAVQAFAQVGGSAGQKTIAHVWSVFAQSHVSAAPAAPPPAKP